MLYIMNSQNDVQREAHELLSLINNSRTKMFLTGELFCGWGVGVGGEAGALCCFQRVKSSVPRERPLRRVFW